MSATQIDVSWNDTSTNESAFVLERSPNGTDTWSTIAPSLAAGTTTYRDSALTPSTTYWYRVKAVNAAGSSAYSNTASATTAAPTTTLFTEPFAGTDGAGRPGTLGRRRGQRRQRGHPDGCRANAV